uniref:protein LAZY 1-like n=1 Tax=Erigeron canadensis TaxID=72917 RepID=UPI001CB9AC96|nr:protein LAZY 1-like [Erigeron canadensis]
MRILGWMQNRIRRNNNDQNIHDSARRSYYFYSAPWEPNELQHSLDANTNSADFKQPAHGVNEDEKVDMSTDFFHQFLAIGTLGSVLTTKEPVTPKTVMHPEIATEKDNGTPDNELLYQNKSESLGEKDTKDNSHTVVCPLKEHSGIMVTKEEEKKQKSTPGDNLVKRYVTCYKRSGKLDKGVERETHPSHFMKKMLKKLDFTSCHSPCPAGDDAIVSESTKKKPIKVFQMSRKIHPQAADHHVTESHNYEVKKIPHDECYENKETLEDVDNMDPQAGMLKKETAASRISADRPINSPPDAKIGHWIKNDANYFVLEFEKFEDNDGVKSF